MGKANYRKINDRSQNSSKYHKLDCVDPNVKMKEAFRREIQSDCDFIGDGDFLDRAKVEIAVYHNTIEIN